MDHEPKCILVWHGPKPTHHALDSEMHKSLWAKLSNWPRHEFPVQLKQVDNGLFVSSLLPCSALYFLQKERADE